MDFQPVKDENNTEALDESSNNKSSNVPKQSVDFEPAQVPILNMNNKQENASKPPLVTVAGSADASVEELVDVDVDMDDDQSVSSIYHPAHTDSLVSNLSQDISNNMSMSKNSSYTSVVSGLDSDKMALQHELLKCEGIKVQLEFSEDFDGDRDDDIDMYSPLDMDILWANPMYLQNDEEGKKHIYIPTDASIETESADELGENPLMNKQKRRKRRTISKSCGSEEKLQPLLNTVASEGRIPDLRASSESDSENTGSGKMSNENDSETATSSTDNEAHPVEPSETAGAIITSVSSSEEGSLSDAATSDIESDGSEYDVDFMGRWDIFWPMMSKSERKMVGAPSEVEINDMESRSFVVSPSENDDSFQLINENEGTSHKTAVDIQELVEESHVSLRVVAEGNDLADEAQQFPTNLMESTGADYTLDLQLCTII